MFSSSRTWTVRRVAITALWYGSMSLLGISMVFPLVWMVLTSFKAPNADVVSLDHLWPQPQALLSDDDLRDVPALARALLQAGQTPAEDLRHQIYRRLPAGLHDGLLVLARGQADEIRRENLLAGLNQVVQASNLYQWASGHLASAAHLFAQHAGQLHTTPAQQAERKNRLLLDTAFPQALAPMRALHWSNYRFVLSQSTVGHAFFNSVFVTVVIVLGQLLTSSLAAYAFARLRFFGRDYLFLGYLATLMVPSVVTMIPVFILLRALHGINTYWALILPDVFTAYGTFMLRQFFLGIPRELEEAAAIDGCHKLQIYWHVILPLSKPALAALGILSFIGEWRSFMWPLIVAQTPDMFTLPVALAQFQERLGIQWSLLMAGSVLMVLPMLVIFIVGQRYFIAGIQLGAVKG